MFYAVGFKNGKIGVLDTDDNTIDWFVPRRLRDIVVSGFEIGGCTLSPGTNPIYTICGMEINLYYTGKNVMRVGNGKFRVVLLKKGERWGRTFSTVVNKPTVFFFDTDYADLKNPSGSFIASYYAETLLKHNLDFPLVLNKEVSDWKISSEDMQNIIFWLKSLL